MYYIGRIVISWVELRVETCEGGVPAFGDHIPKEDQHRFAQKLSHCYCTLNPILRRLRSVRSIVDMAGSRDMRKQLVKLARSTSGGRFGSLWPVLKRKGDDTSPGSSLRSFTMIKFR